MKHYVGVCLILVTIAVLTLVVINRCTAAAGSAVDRVRDAFAAVLQVQPKITINSRVIQSQTAPIAELAVVTREESVSLGFDEHKELWSYTLPLTEKKLTVTGGLSRQSRLRFAAALFRYHRSSHSRDHGTHAAGQNSLGGTGR